MNTEFPYLSMITFAPLIGAFFVAWMPKAWDREIKVTALAASAVSLVLSVMVWLRFDPSGGLMFVERHRWIPAIHVDYFLGVDGLSITMLLLTAVITPLAIRAHRTNRRQPGKIRGRWRQSGIHRSHRSDG